MKLLSAVLSILSLVVLVNESQGGIAPSFYLDHCVWQATHIVVVTEGDKIDGGLEVLDSWKGDCKRGERLNIPELGAFAPEKTRKISKRLFQKEKDDRLPKLVTCSRMVLFLIRKNVQADKGRPSTTVWLPAGGDWGGMTVSAAWIEAENVFAFVQQLNPGPSELIWYGMKECGLQCEIDNILAAQRALHNAIGLENTEKIAAEISQLLRSDSEYLQQAVIFELGAVGPRSLSALRGILKQEELLRYHNLTIESLARAGGIAVGPELTNQLRQELDYWKKVGPNLKKGWWNGAGLEWENVGPLRDRYCRMYSVLTALKTLRFAACKDAVERFCTFWRSHPQLAELDQIGEECDAVLAAIR